MAIAYPVRKPAFTHAERVAALAAYGFTFEGDDNPATVAAFFSFVFDVVTA